MKNEAILPLDECCKTHGVSKPTGELATKDPVCGMDVDPNDAEGKVTHEGKDYFFCSKHCLKAFQK